MNTLAQLFSSRVRARIFRVLFGVTDSELHVRELARQCDFHEATVRQELRKLRDLDLVSERRDGNRVYFRANRRHPLYSDLHNLVLKTCGLADVLRSRLEVRGIVFAFVFGSVAMSRETTESDVDLMVIGTIGLRKLTSLLTGIPEELGREVNPHVLTKEEYSRRLETGDHFVTHVLSGSKIFVVGTEDEFAAMGR